MTLTLAIVAKEPIPGHTKTRLCPPLSLAQAAGLAGAALADTLAAVAATPADRRVLVLAGRPPPWLPEGIEVIAQRGNGLDERLANAFADLAGPSLLIGMDTPQIGPRTLAAGLARLGRAPAVLGPAEDGGYWAIGLRHPDARALIGVPMSSSGTLAAQRVRLAGLGLAVDELETLRDVDTYADALAVAGAAADTRFAARLAALGPGRTAA